MQLHAQLKKLEEHVEYLTKLLENNQCPECKKNKTLRKTEPEIINKIDTSLEAEEPTGLVSMRNAS